MIYNNTIIQEKIKELSPWYHKVKLTETITTPGRDYDHMWNATRRLLNLVDYREKTVLDLGTWDGLWAFEAEQRGASQVVATEARALALENFLFAKQVLNSKAKPFFNVPAAELSNRLRSVGLVEKFDIIQHFGLLYHLRDPLLSFKECRKMLSKGGLLLIETAFIDNDSESFMLFSGTDDNRHFYGPSDTWAPTKLCLLEMLERSMFEPIEEQSWQYVEGGCRPNKPKVGRITLQAKAVGRSSVHVSDLEKLSM